MMKSCGKVVRVIGLDHLNSAVGQNILNGMVIKTTYLYGVDLLLKLLLP